MNTRIDVFIKNHLNGDKHKAAKIMGIAYPTIYMMIRKKMRVLKTLAGDYAISSERQKSFGNTDDIDIKKSGVYIGEFCWNFKDKKTAAKYIGISHFGLLNIFNSGRDVNFKIVPLESGKFLKVGEKTRVFRIDASDD